MTSMTAKSPEDVLAAIPVILGFHPENSIAMLTFGGSRSFHARIDLPGADEPEEVTSMIVQRLLQPVVAQRATSVLFAFYGDEVEVIETVFAELLSACRRAGVGVIDALRVTGGRWFHVGRPGSTESAGTPFDVGDHPFAAQAVMDGMVTAGSRGELADRLAHDERASEAVAGLIRRARRLRPASLRALVQHHAMTGTRLSDEDAAAVMKAVSSDPLARNMTWWRVPRPESEQHMWLWVDVVRRAPAAQLADAAGVLAMLAWLAGHGSIAWCAIDRGHEVADSHVLLDLVAELLETGTPPIEDWDAYEVPDAG
ncbi:DUF4192 domain-containing protein [Nocardioides sp. Kera G14]|uniref:DUF4192 domain-containing protein n=1 Tax=Nocardioides sp. Kera G14 TaxID=2884264 RepID=UPI001D1115C3|nr:DUF4192 domain-containing protein [Nocardioides sp. Kera G14]UDY22407.1 DUF4192 domain-containing protein [Nocardioides sp. Kera G14]